MPFTRRCSKQSAATDNSVVWVCERLKRPFVLQPTIILQESKIFFPASYHRNSIGLIANTPH